MQSRLLLQEGDDAEAKHHEQPTDKDMTTNDIKRASGELTGCPGFNCLMSCMAVIPMVMRSPHFFQSTDLLLPARDRSPSFFLEDISADSLVSDLLCLRAGVRSNPDTTLREMSSMAYSASVGTLANKGGSLRNHASAKGDDDNDDLSPRYTFFFRN